MASVVSPSPPEKKPSGRGARLKRSFAQSTYVTAVWTWFMILAGKAAEPVLVMSVLYASVKLLPIVHFAPQVDAVVFVAQFIALDVGGLSLNKLADQALKDGNTEGAKQAKRLSIALVSVMLAGVVIAGVEQVVKLDEQVSTIIDTILLIARAIMAVLYSRVIHALKQEDLFDNPISHDVEATKELLTKVLTSLAEQMKADQAEQMRLSQEQFLAAINEVFVEQSEMLRNITQSQEQQETVLLSLEERQKQILAADDTDALSETIMAHSGTKLAPLQAEPETCQREVNGTKHVPPRTRNLAHTFLSEASVSQKEASQEVALPETTRGETAENEVDKRVWPLLDAGQTVRGIAGETGIAKATVGRSRLRWVAQRGIVSASEHGTLDLSHESQASEVSPYTPDKADLS